MIPAIPDWLKPLYPFAPQSFTTPSGARMSYLDEGGQGTEAVVMLHGNPTWSFYYRDLVKAISPKMRCIVPDHIGMGLSEKPENYSYTLATRIADVEALLASLGITKIHLVVHDWGGAIGFGVAGHRPEDVGRIVVLNTAAFASKNIPKRIALCKAGALGTFIIRKWNGFAGPAVTMSMHRRKLSSDEKRGFLLPYDSWENRVAVNAFVQDIPMNDKHPTWATLAEVEEHLRLFKKNTALIVWGGRDFCFDDSYYVEWRKRLPQAESLYLKDAGHYVLADADAEVIPRIASFLTD